MRNLPGLFLVEIDRGGRVITPVSPDVTILAGDRLVFAGAFGILSWAVLGLDGLRGRSPDNRAWFALPILLLTALVYTCVRYAGSPPGASPLIQSTM